MKNVNPATLYKRDDDDFSWHKNFNSTRHELRLWGVPVAHILKGNQNVHTHLESPRSRARLHSQALHMTQELLVLGVGSLRWGLP